LIITLVSLVVNTMAFLLVFNWSYIQKRRVDPDYPPKPIAQSILFPVGLGIAYTILVDAYKGIIYYQFLLFLIVAVVLFWAIYGNKHKGN
jgi:hypothetical protein